MRWYRGLCTGLLAFIYLTCEGNPRKPQLGDRFMKLWDQSSPQMGVPYLQMRSVGSHSTSVREKEGKYGEGIQIYSRDCNNWKAISLGDNISKKVKIKFIWHFSAICWSVTESTAVRWFSWELSQSNNNNNNNNNNKKKIVAIRLLEY